MSARMPLLMSSGSVKPRSASERPKRHGDERQKLGLLRSGGRLRCGTEGWRRGRLLPWLGMTIAPLLALQSWTRNSRKRRGAVREP